MAEQWEERIAEWLGINLNTLTPADRKGLVIELFDTLTAGELRELRDIAEQKRQEKLEEAKHLVLDEMRQKFVDLGLEPSEVRVFFGRRRARRDSGGALPVKYRSPDGQHSWSGRGNVPIWLVALEREGHRREEFLVRSAKAGEEESEYTQNTDYDHGGEG